MRDYGVMLMCSVFISTDTFVFLSGYKFVLFAAHEVSMNTFIFSLDPAVKNEELVCELYRTCLQSLIFGKICEDVELSQDKNFQPPVGELNP